MSDSLEQRLYDELEQLVLIDPHTHINPHAPASKNLADIMGYHYFTELAHSAGMPREHVEAPDITPKEKVGRLVEWLGALDNTVQVSWLIEICREFFGFQDDQITTQNWEALYDFAAERMSDPEWEKSVLTHSRLEKIFLTNDFDDPLEGFDTERYIPCLRTDDLVFHLTKAEVRERFASATQLELSDATALKEGIGRLFKHFVSHNARACAISLPPDFAPAPAADSDANTVIQRLVGGQELSVDEAKSLSHYVFWSLAEQCAEHNLPFDLMIGVNRRVYESGVFQGQDLFDKRVSLIQYRALLNAFPQVTFPISVLGQTSNQELASYAWIFPNVVTNGHWWYSNIPTYIEQDTRGRLEAVPRTKQIGYYSDMYKLEFALPKFRMYRQVLARVLAREFVVHRHWSEAKALELGCQVLRGNVETIFRMGESPVS